MNMKLFSGNTDLNKVGFAEFTKEEEYKFLLQNGKYNKRNSSNVQSKIHELRRNLDMI